MVFHRSTNRGTWLSSSGYSLRSLCKIRLINIHKDDVQDLCRQDFASYTRRTTDVHPLYIPGLGLFLLCSMPAACSDLGFAPLCRSIWTLLPLNDSTYFFFQAKFATRHSSTVLQFEKSNASKIMT